MNRRHRGSSTAIDPRYHRAMDTISRILLPTALLALLAACGNKGDLVQAPAPSPDAALSSAMEDPALEADPAAQAVDAEQAAPEVPVEEAEPEAEADAAADVPVEEDDPVPAEDDGTP